MVEVLAAYAAWAVSSKDTAAVPKLTPLCMDTEPFRIKAALLSSPELVLPQEQFPVNRMTRHTWDNF